MYKSALFLVIFCLLSFSMPAQNHWASEMGFDEQPSPKVEYAFQFSPPSTPSLRLLAEEARLDSLIRPFDPALEKVKIITHHIHFLLKMDKTEVVSPKNRSNPLALFRAGLRDRAIGATDLSVVLSACFTSCGIPSRLVFLQKKEGLADQRVVVEAWIKESQQWAVCDAALDFVPADLGHTLSLVDLLKLLGEKQRPYNMVTGSSTSPKQFAKAIKPYLHVFYTRLDQRFLDENELGPWLLLAPRNAKQTPKNIGGQKVYLTHSLADFYKTPD